MRTKKEVKEKLAQLYDCYESFNSLIKKENCSDELNVGFSLAKRVFLEKIDILNWILNNDNQRD